jgi:hypothetical protein
MSSYSGEQSWDRSKDAPVAGLAAVQDRFAAWLLDWPLTVFLSLVCLFMLATWIPHYVTWPWYCDHDHFAELAQLWDSGTARPYRDVFSFQFPGEIYVFWVLGRVFGWGNSIAFYAFDAILVIGFGVILSLWSRRLCGRIAPGLIGYSVFLYYYLGLDYRLAAQRDWHTAFLALLGLLLPDLLSGRRGRITSGAAFGLSLVFRPQMLLLLPALLLSLDRSARSRGEPAKKTLLALMEWGVGALGAVILGFLPLVADGLVADFLRNLREVDSPSSPWNNVFGSANLLFELPRLSGFVLAPLLVFLLIPSGRKDLIRRACEITVALGGIAVYKAVSPVYHPYHEVPQIATLAVALVFLAGMIQVTPASAPVQFAMLLLLFMFGMPHCPRFALAKLEPLSLQSYGVLEALPLISSGRSPLLVPPGFQDNPHYQWFEVRDMVSYLRGTTSATTPVANMLFDGVTAVTAAIPRLSALPIDNKLLRHFSDRDKQIAHLLEENENCVVVWNPRDSLWLRLRFQPWKQVIEQRYRKEARFGLIEVWRHLPRQTSSRNQDGGRRDPATRSSEPAGVPEALNRRASS